MTNKKSQMEILGLAIVVILIVIASTFVLRFMVLKEPTDQRKGFVSSELASNMLNTLLNTAAPECRDLTMTELLQDCAQRTGIICNNLQNSCDFVANTSTYIFNETLEKWNYDYMFTAYIIERNPLISIGEECPGNRKMKVFPIPTNVGTMYAKLELCG